MKLPGKLIFETISGSHSYGLNVATSDVDIRGIYLNDPIPTLLSRPDQVSDNKNDITYYGLEKFLKLAKDCNPNIIELLYVDDKFIEVMTPEMKVLRDNRDIFISKKCYHTFSGYAYAQIKKAKGQNKWVNNPQPKEAPKREDYLWFLEKGSQHPMNINDQSYKSFLEPTFSCIGKMKKSKMEHIPNLYKVFDRLASKQELFVNGKIHCESIDLQEDVKEFIGFIYFNETAYDQAKRDHDNYWEWIANRNEARWVSQENGEIDYDTKNMMHCLRLLFSCRNILKYGSPIVYIDDDSTRSYLMDVRNGKFPFEEVMEYVENLMVELEDLKENSTIPHKVDDKKIDEVYRKTLENNK